MELRILSNDKEEIRKNRRLYYEAFPKIERAPFSLMIRRNRQRKGDYLCFYEGNEWVGFAYVVSNDSVAYIFYLAIVESNRSKGLGSLALQEIIKRYDKQKVFLALEKLDENAPNAAIRARRFDFYSRNGLSLLDRCICEGGVEFAAMSAGGDITPEEYRDLMKPFAGWFYIKLYNMELH